MRSKNYILFIKGLRTSKIGIYKYFGVRKNSYAGTIISRIYDYYCIGARNLFLEYLRFYRKEFSSYKEFLIQKYNVDDKAIEKVVPKRLYCKDIEKALDGQIDNFSYYDNFAKMIKEFIGWQTNEN